MEKLDRFPQIGDGHQDVLAHMAVFVVGPDPLALGQFEESDLRRHHPPEQVAKQGMVAEGDDELPFPEQTTRVAMVILPRGRYSSPLPRSRNDSQCL